MLTFRRITATPEVTERVAQDSPSPLPACCEEIRLGIAEPELWRRAVQKAGGVEAVAIQAYWRLRAENFERRTAFLDEAAADDLFETWQIQVYKVKRRNTRLRSVAAWTWIGIFVLSVIGNFALMRLTVRAFARRGPGFYLYGALWLLVSIALVRSLIEGVRLRCHPTPKFRRPQDNSG